MARTILEDEQLRSYTLKAWLRVALYGLLVGAVYWLMTLALSRWVVEPFTCRQLVDAASCTNALQVAGKIATVLTAVLAIAGMVRLRVARPIVIAVVAAIVLWELTSYTQGLFWIESIGWTIGLYGLTYALFGWIARATSSAVALIIAVVVAVLIRVVLII